MNRDKLHARAIEVELRRILTAESGPDWQHKVNHAREAGAQVSPGALCPQCDRAHSGAAAPEAAEPADR